MNATTIPSRTLRVFAAAVKWSLWLLLAASLLLALAWGALHGWIVPRIGELRPVLEKRASQVLGVPVRIAAISARSEGLIPSFELAGVVLLDAQGREALRLPRVTGSLSPRSLWNLGFEQLYIDQPQLEIRRTRDGSFFVAGIDFSRRSDGEGRAADWFFSQREFVIRGGTLQWTDELRAAPPLALQQVDLVVRNKARQHALRLDATPPTEWGERFTVAGVFRQPLLTGKPGQWQQWTGEMHADFAAVDLSRLRRHADLGFEISHGHGRLRAWADVERGQVVSGAADVVLADVDATLGRGLEPLQLRSLSGRLGGKRLAGGFQMETRNLQFLTQDGLAWPGGNLALTWTDEKGAAPAQGELHADRLDLGALRAIATRVPLATATHAAFKTHAPEGLVDTLDASWQMRGGALEKFQARGRASRLALAAQAHPEGRAGTPGLSGAAIDFDFNQGGGRARIAIQRGTLEFPGVFEEPALPMDTLQADLKWQREGDAISVQASNVRFANADTQGEAQVQWRTGDARKGGARFPGVLDLQASLGRTDGTRVWRYLPNAVSAQARHYVRDAVTAGIAQGAKARVRGDLRHFPWADGKEGEFLITAPVRDVQFAYVPHAAAAGVAWPALTQLDAELVFQGNGMQIKEASGRVQGGPRLQFTADARIPDFHHSEVQVEGRVRGPMADALAFVQNSPVNAMLNQALARANGSGQADVALKLALPLHDMARSQVQGSVTLAGNDLQVTPDSPQLARARGVVQFSDKGFQLAGVQARALGGDVRLEGGSRPGPAGEGQVQQLRAQGTITAEGLRQARELGFLARMARDFSGSTSYNMALTFRRAHPEILITSNLQGMALNLPAPLAKPAEAVLPLRYENALTRESLQPVAAGAAPRLHELLSVELGRVVAVQYLRDVSGPEAQVLRGSIALGLAPGESVVMPDEGVMANLQFGSVNVDAWEDAVDRMAGDTAASAAPAASAAAAPAAPRNAGPSNYLPTVLAVRAKALSVEGRTLHNVVLGGSRDGRLWRANVDADELGGYVEYRQPQNTGAGRVYARLARLNVAAAAAQQVETLLEQQPGNIPALDVVVEDFELKGRKLGRLEIDAINRGAGAVAREGGIREWRLNKLSLVAPDSTFSASGNWAAVGSQAAPVPGARPAPEKRRTAMKFKLEIANAGELLNRMGMKDVVRRGRGTMEGSVGWLGSPLAIDYPSLTGSFNVNVEAGQFLKADPGLAKLLGVLSLQSLPRRLTLDFRDVFSEGFAFDFVRGDVQIEQGVAATNNLQMKGVSAAVLMEGKADIARETQDLKVVVVPEINAATASLVVGVINPAIGLGTLLAQMALRQPLMKAATQEFRIDGSWYDPRIQRISGSTQAAGAGSAPATPAEAQPPIR